MSEQRKRELLEAAERAMAEWRALSPEERSAELKRIGIVGADGQLAEQYGGPARAESVAR